MPKQCIITNAVIKIEPIVTDGIVEGERKSIQCIFQETFIDPETNEIVVFPQSTSVSIKLADHPEILAKVEEVVALVVPVAKTLHEAQQAGESQ